MKVKSILVTQPKPESDKSPYFDLAQKFNLQIDFRPFIHIEGVNSIDFRKTKVNILDHQAVVLTSRNAVDHFFRLCNELRITVPENLKYFCLTESTAYYLQKYVVFRKRKIFHGRSSFNDLLDVVKKHKDDNFLLPCSNIHGDEITSIMDNIKLKYTKSVFYNTVCSNLSDLENVFYDILVFFSPYDIKSLFENFPNFKQNNTRIAAFGKTTVEACEEAKLIVNIPAPTSKAPSMTMALEQYIASVNK